MNARERVMLALNHKEPDRIPIDLGGSICSSIHRDAYIELKKHLGMDLEEIQMVDYVQQLPYLDEALLERFGVDFRMVQLPAATASDVNIFEEGDYYAFIDRWGSKLYGHGRHGDHAAQPTKVHGAVVCVGKLGYLARI